MRFIVAQICVLMMGVCAGEQSAYSIALEKWETLAFSGNNSLLNPVIVKQAYEDLNECWRSLPEEEKLLNNSIYYSQMAIKYAEVALSKNDINAAQSGLNDSIAEAKKHDFKIGATKGGTPVLEETAKVITDIWRATGNNPIEANQKYFVFEVGKFENNFIVVSQGAPDTLFNDAGEAIIAGTPSLPEDEEIGYFFRMSNKLGGVEPIERGLISLTKEKTSESLFARIKSIYKYRPSGPQGPSRYVQAGTNFPKYIKDNQVIEKNRDENTVRARANEEVIRKNEGVNWGWWFIALTVAVMSYFGFRRKH